MLRDITRNLPQQHDLLITHGPHEDNLRDTLQEEARYHQDTAVRSIHVHLQGAPRTQGSELRPHKHPRSLHRHSLSQKTPGILHHRWSCTRHHIAFDPYLYPFKLNATATPAWQTFHNLTTPKPPAAIKDFEVPQMNTDLPHTEELADNSEESDFDPERTSSGKHVNGNRRPPAGTNGFRKRRRTNDASTSSSAHSQHPGTEGTSSTSDLQGAGKTDCLPALQQR